jgi:hypothetical protein
MQGGYGDFLDYMLQPFLSLSCLILGAITVIAVVGIAVWIKRNTAIPPERGFPVITIKPDNPNAPDQDKTDKNSN